MTCLSLRVSPWRGTPLYVEETWHQLRVFIGHGCICTEGDCFPVPALRQSPLGMAVHTASEAVLRAEPDCVKTRSFLVPWDTVMKKRPKPSRLPYSAPVLDTKWGTRPSWAQSQDFSHSLEHWVSLHNERRLSAVRSSQ